ncbi:ABC transporter ATP-binding protein [Thermodesulfobacteriota bacterium]
MKIHQFNIKPLYSNLNALIRNAGWAISLTWNTNWKILLGVIIANLIQSVTPVGLALSARGVVNAVVEILDKGSHNTTTLMLWLAAGLALTVFEALSRFGLDLFMRLLKDEVNLRITSDILEHAAGLELGYFEDSKFQDIIERARQNPAENFVQFLNSTIAAIRNVLQSLSLIALLFMIAPLIVLIMFPIAIPYLYYQWRLSKLKYQFEYSRATKRRWTEYFISKLTSYESVPEVKILGLPPLLIKRFKVLMSEFLEQDRVLYVRRFIIDTIFALLTTTAAYFVFLRVSLGALSGGVTVGDVAIFGGAAIRLRIAIEQSIMFLTNAMERTLYISNLSRFFGVKSMIDPKEGITLDSCKGKIEMEDVIFTYPGSKNPAIQGVSLKIEPGETVALVGENGSGKTTLAKLIARFYDPDEGIVKLDGHDLKKISIEYLHENVSLILQNFGRYEATVFENIAYGDWKRLLNNPREVESISEKGGVAEMIHDMPQGYQTMLGRSFGEYTLSGGQWQQIALARAFGRNAAVFILDEPTSNLDAQAEYKLFLRLKKVSEGRTTILISHRFSTVSMADRIIVLKNGKVREEGTHEMLLKNKDLYYRLYNFHKLQMQGDASQE